MEQRAAHTDQQIIKNPQKELLVIDLLRMSQGDKSAMEFVEVGEDQAKTLRRDVENQGGKRKENAANLKQLYSSCE